VPSSSSEKIISDHRLADEYLLRDTLDNRQHYSALSLQIFGRKYLRCDEAVKIILSAPGLRGLMVIVTERSILDAPFFAPFLRTLSESFSSFPGFVCAGSGSNRGVHTVRVVRYRVTIAPGNSAARLQTHKTRRTIHWPRRKSTRKSEEE